MVRAICKGHERTRGPRQADFPERIPGYGHRPGTRIIADRQIPENRIYTNGPGLAGSGKQLRQQERTPAGTDLRTRNRYAYLPVNSMINLRTSVQTLLFHNIKHGKNSDKNSDHNDADPCRIHTAYSLENTVKKSLI